MEAIPGEVQVADIGTKVLSSPRLEALKKKMGMEEKSVDEKGEKITEEEKIVEDEVGRRAEIPGGVRDLENAMSLVALAVLVSKGRAQGGEEGFKEEGQWLLLAFMVGVISIVIGAVLFGALILRTMKAWFSQRRSIKEEPSYDENAKEEIKEHTPKELRRRTPVPKGSPGSEKSGIYTSSTRSMTFPVQHLEKECHSPLVKVRRT